MGGLICNGQQPTTPTNNNNQQQQPTTTTKSCPVPAKILPAANQAPHKTEGLPRRITFELRPS
jgi:hypothetical protein